ncbi:DUF262 domain-containing protein [Lachnospiraceae bacterium 29-91]
MNSKLKKDLDALIKIGEARGSLRTYTVEQLLNDLGLNTDETFGEAVDYIENSKKMILIVDDEEEKRNVLDSSKIAILPKTLSVEAIVKRLKNNEINLDTEFQRKKSLWSPTVKSQLIESLMIQLPIPPMYFDGRDTNAWLVIDGLQRLCTLKEFIIEKRWKLKGLEYLPDYNNCSIEELPRVYQRRIEEAQISFYLILPDTPAEVKYSLFKRINTPGLRLEPQEIRHALYRGKAAELVRDLAENKLFIRATGESVPTERMQDREMVLRYLALHYMGIECYREETMDNYLNKTMEFLNRQDDRFIEECKELFFESIDCIYKIFGKKSFRRISKIKPNDLKPINTALFESWINAFADLTENQRNQLIEQGDKLIQLYVEELDKRSSFYNDIGSGKYRSFVRRNETIKKLIQEVLTGDK